MPIRCVERGYDARMDDIDRQIVALLRENARSSFQDIGQRVSLSAPAVKRRVDRLEADGVLRGLHGGRRHRPRWAGRRTPSSRCTARGGWRRPRCARRSPAHPEVSAAYTVAGEASAILHVRARDTAAPRGDARAHPRHAGDHADADAGRALDAVRAAGRARSAATRSARSPRPRAMTSAAPTSAVVAMPSPSTRKPRITATTGLT